MLIFHYLKIKYLLIGKDDVLELHPEQKSLILAGRKINESIPKTIADKIKRLIPNKNSKILDIGCGRANIISALQKKYKFRNKPIGIDVVANKDVKKSISISTFDSGIY